MDACKKLKKDVWVEKIFPLCTPSMLRNLRRTCKQMKDWCDLVDRWSPFIRKGEFRLQQIDLKKKIFRMERVGGSFLVLTESFQLIDASQDHILMDNVHDFACDQKKVVVCRQVEEEFCFEQYVWPLFEKPLATSECLKSVAEHLCIRSDQLIGCINKARVVLWNFELPGVVLLDKLDGAVAGLAFDSNDQVVVCEGFYQPRYQVWKADSWSQKWMSHRDPTSELWCSYGAKTVVATDTALQLIESEQKVSKKDSPQSELKRCKLGPRKVTLLELPRLESIQGVKGLFGGRAFVTLDDSGQLILWFSATEKRVLCEQDPFFKFVADQLTVGTDADGYPVIAYVMSDTKVRVFSRAKLERE